jgi:hypothetical protein
LSGREARDIIIFAGAAMGATVVIEIPDMPITPLLLSVLVVLLTRILAVMKEIAAQAQSAREPEVETRSRPRAHSTRDDPPPSGSSDSGERILRDNARVFAAALLGEHDVDVTAFEQGCRMYGAVVLSKLGTATSLAAKEVQANMDKVATSRSKLSAMPNIDADQLRTMRVLLSEEKSVVQHSAAKGLSDPSAAMGLLWARRGLRYWVALFRPVIDGTGGPPAEAWSVPAANRAGAADGGFAAATKAFEESMAPHMGWVTRNTFMMTARVMPSWDTIGPTLAPSLDALRDDVGEWVRALDAILARMERMHLEMDLEDQRKSY